MARVQGQIQRPVPPGTYLARFSGFVRDGEGRPVLRERESRFTNEDGEEVTRTTMKCYWSFEIVSGEYAGEEVVGSTPFRGVTFIEKDGVIVPRFKAPGGGFAPNFITWLAACGLDFQADLARPLFETPVTPESVLDGLEAVLKEKAQDHLVNVKVIAGQDGSPWVDWNAGVTPAPPEVARMVLKELVEQEGERASKERVKQQLKKLLTAAREAGLLEEMKQFLKQQAKENWDIEPEPGQKLTSLLTEEQLQVLVDELLVVLNEKGVEIE